MKKFLLSLLTLFVVSATAWADEATFVAGTDTGETSVTKGDVTVTMSTMSRTDNYRCYSGSNMVVSAANDAVITRIDVTCTASGTAQYGPGKFTLLSDGSYSYSGTVGTWTGSSSEVTLKADGSQVRMTQIVVTYTAGGAPVVETVATPVISPASHNFSDDFDATITCATDGASIFYSLDGSEPSIAYTGPVSIDAGASVTLKAKATKTDYNDSAVAEAIYTYVEPAPEGAKYQVVDISEITASDIVVIYDTNSERAMSNNNGTSAAPSAVAVGHNSDGSELVYADVTDNLKWNIVKSGDNYIIYPNGTTDTWLYCTATNNGVRVGSTNDAKTFTTGETSGRVYLQHIGTSRYLGVYNNQDWRCYTSMGSNIANQNTKFYRYIASAGAQVETPAISPNGGSDLTEAQTVTLSCETDGASIYYTLDGSTPTAESTLYSAPFTVSENTTVKAIGIKEGLTNSAVSTATFSFRVAATSIADLYTKTGKDNSTEIYVNFPLTVTAAGSSTVANTYVMDGQGGYSMIYKAGNTEYSVGDVIPGGWYAKVQTYKGLDEIIPTEATPAASSQGATVDYPVSYPSFVAAENQSHPATIRLTFAEATPSTKSAFTGVSGETTVSLFNTWVLESRAAGTYDVKGVVSVNNNNPQFLPVDFEEVQPEPVPDVYILGNVDGNEWAPNVGVQMHYDDVAENYTATIHVGATGGSFNMATALGEDDDWSHFNGHNYRWGVQGGSDHNVTVAEYGTALGAQMWDNNPGAWVLPVGNYNLTWTFTGEYTATLVIEKAPSDVYIIGTVNGNSFAYDNGIEMVRDEQTGIYSAQVYAPAGAMINFAHALADSWEHMNTNGNRFSVDQNDNYNVTGIETDILLAYKDDPKSIVFQNARKYEVRVNLDNNGSMTADVYPLIMDGPEFSVTSKEFHEAFDLTITGPEGSTITYVLNDDLNNPVTVNTNVAELTIPAEDTTVSAWYTIYGVDSEIVDEVYLYSEAVDVPAGQYWKVTASDQPLEAGKYLIVCEAVDYTPSSGAPQLREASVVYNPVFDGSLDNPNVGQNYISTPRNGDEIELDESADTYYFNIAPVEGKENTYTIQTASGKYIGRAAGSNGMDVSEEPLENTITIDEDGNAIITGEGGRELQYNPTSGSSNERFRYYGGTQQPVQLYFNGQTVTGVDKVAASDSEVVSTAYYNLQGVRLAAPAQGQIAIRVSTLANGQIRASKVVVR